MDILRAKEIISTLADGINPLTGEVLPLNDSCNQGDVVRALNAILAALPEKAEKNFPENSGKPWTEEDDQKLCKMFDNGLSKTEICGYFKRSTGGIASRLVHLGKIQNRDEFRHRL